LLRVLQALLRIPQDASSAGGSAAFASQGAPQGALAEEAFHRSRLELTSLGEARRLLLLLQAVDGKR
jgi:hypothetical protein